MNISVRKPQWKALLIKTGFSTKGLNTVTTGNGFRYQRCCLHWFSWSKRKSRKNSVSNRLLKSWLQTSRTEVLTISWVLWSYPKPAINCFQRYGSNGRLRTGWTEQKLFAIEPYLAAKSSSALTWTKQASMVSGISLGHPMGFLRCPSVSSDSALCVLWRNRGPQWFPVMALLPDIKSWLWNLQAAINNNQNVRLIPTGWS